MKITRHVVKYHLNMLSHLTINNFGLIDRLSIEFREGLNVFTGETGAGKSILIDALRCALGDKLNSRHVRNAGQPCVIEAAFELSDKQLAFSPVLVEHVQDSDPLLIINRKYTPDGRARNTINGFAVTISQLKEIGNHLVDLHGPHDHQMLFSEDSHIGILDRLSDLNTEKEEYARIFGDYTRLSKELDDLKSMADNRDREMDILSHQIKELEQVPLEEDKYEELLQDGARVNNAEKLYESASQLITILENDESGMDLLISRAFTSMNNLNRTDETTSEFADILARIQEDSSTLSSALQNYADSLSFEPDAAERLNKSCDVYQDILRKYGPSLKDARAFHEEASRKYALLMDLEHNGAALKVRLAKENKTLERTARKMTSIREKTAAKLKVTIERELKELGIARVRFECRIERTALGRNGHDRCVFYISPNTGEDMKPLAEIVSSGEAARVMLALKKALTTVDPIPVLIFDEIDAQIGGRLGTVTGEKLRELSSGRQVILITHLPQIASFGTRHMKVSKDVENGRTITRVNLLDGDARIEELAQMMSGEEKSSIAVKHAVDMLARAGA